MMETRRSKRIFTKINCTENISESPVQKKKRSCISNSRKNNSEKSFRKMKSPYFDSEMNSKITDDSKKSVSRNKNKKSSYFESPGDSEKSTESEYEPESPVSGKITTAYKSSSKFQKIHSDSDASSEDFVNVSKSFKRISKSSNNASAQESSQSNNLPKIKNSYESESDSSSDEFPKAPKLVRELEKVDSCKCTNDLHTICDSENNTVTTANDPVEYFDFTPLLSQVTESNEQAVKNKDDKKNFGKEKKQSNKEDLAQEKKSKQSKKLPKNAKNSNTKTEQMEVFELLALGENTDLSANDIKESVAKSSEEYEIPKQVEILLDAPANIKKKRCNDLEMALRRRLNNIRRENQVYIHKVHALCWIAHGNYINSVLNSADVLSIALSLIPSEKCYAPKRMDLKYLDNLMDWFNKKVKLKKESSDEDYVDLCQKLQAQFQKLEADTKTNFCFMFICLVRALGIQCRLIINLNVAPIKPTSDQLLSVNQTKNENEQKLCSKEKKSIPANKNNANANTNSNSQKNVKKRKDQKSVEIKKSDKSKAEKFTKVDVKKKESSRNTSNSESKSSEKKKQSVYFKDIAQGSRRSSRLTHTNSKYFDEISGSDEKAGSPSKRSSRSQSNREMEPKTNISKKKVTKNEIESEESVEEMSNDDSDDDFEEVMVSPKKKKKIDRRVLSSDEETEDKQPENKTHKGNKNNYWMEIFLEAEEKWFCVDITKNSYHCVKLLYNSTSHPVRYILAWNSDQTIKDVTKRYVPQYLTVTRKLRADENWWRSTMELFKPLNTPQNREEDEELEKLLEEQALPTSIHEYKNHPLYALKRHLLKFQAIYPPDSPSLGFIKGEPVYSRLCVHQLHGREMWIKEAKVVKLNETPYKIVKGRPQRNKFGTSEPPKDLELFGLWQVEDYIPPIAENGKVPRNAFGNVELFKPTMLPKGTVYLQLPGLQKIANKLNIDCATAIVGFEYSTNGWSYPVKDGFVVCEEFKDILLDAYHQELEEAEKKEKQKREDRVYANWKLLIRGLFIREKLKRKYNFGDPSTSLSDTSSSKGRKKKSS